MEYYLAIGGQQRGPFPKEQLLGQGLRNDTLVWTDGMPQWLRADAVPELASLFAAPPPFTAQPPHAAPVGYAIPAGYPTPGQYADPNINGTKIAAGICGILVGGFGVHKFIIGCTGAGMAMLLISLLSCGIGLAVMHVIGIVEGILYLCKSDAEFYQTYMVQKKAWF